MWGGALALRVFQMFIGLFFLEGRKSYLLSIYIYHITLIGNWKNSQFLFSTFAPRALVVDVRGKRRIGTYHSRMARARCEWSRFAWPGSDFRLQVTKFKSSNIFNLVQCFHYLLCMLIIANVGLFEPQIFRISPIL